jgi:hypothetical protein
MTFNWALNGHLISLASLVFLYLSMLFVLKKYINFIELIKKIKLIAPLIFMFIFNTLFTGVILFILSKKSFSFDILLMIIALLVVFILEIKRYKKQKVITSYNYIAQVEFINFARKVYIIDILIFLFVYIIV